MTTWRPPWRLMLLTGVGYSAGALLAWTLLHAGASAAVFFTSAGVTSAALVLSDRRRWPWVLATVAIIEVLIDRWQGVPVGTALGLAAANTAEPLLGAVL